MSLIKDKLSHATGRKHSVSSTGSNSRTSTDEMRDHTTVEDETVVDEAQGNILSHIISQLRPGADLSRVTLPTFFLEPRSMLERITNFMAHPETLLPPPDIDDPVQRFVSVVKFYLSGWHIKPPGVKKPLNPILGETFACYWEYPDHTKGYYIAEQTSHHPPKSSYFFMAPEHHIRVDGTLKPRSKFLGNSAASMMEGLAVMRFLNREERYFITQPNMYARGILFGKMKYELGDHSFVRCPELGLEADIEFKTKGYFGGTYNAIGGFIKESKTGKQLFELSGLWSSEVFIKDLSTNNKSLLFRVADKPPTYPLTRPIPEQEERESQRLWAKVNEAVRKRDQDTATTEKNRIEDMQREEAARRVEEGVDWRPRLFRAIEPGNRDAADEGELDWIINRAVDNKAGPEQQTKQILAIAAILPGQGTTQYTDEAVQKQQQKHSSPPQDNATSNTSEDLIDISTGASGVAQAIGSERAPAAAPGGPSAVAERNAELNKTPSQNAPGDLIDFGEDDATKPAETRPPQEGEPGHALVKGLEKLRLQKESAVRPGNQPGHLKRVDSETGGVDDFADAES